MLLPPLFDFDKLSPLLYIDESRDEKDPLDLPYIDDDDSGDEKDLLENSKVEGCDVDW